MTAHDEPGREEPGHDGSDHQRPGPDRGPAASPPPPPPGPAPWAPPPSPPSPSVPTLPPTSPQVAVPTLPAQEPSLRPATAELESDQHRLTGGAPAPGGVVPSPFTLVDAAGAHRPSRPHVRLAWRARLAQLGLVLAIAAVGYVSTVIYRERSLLVDARDGRDVALSELVDIDDQFSRAFAVFGVAMVISAVSFIVWFHRAYKNVAIFAKTQYGTGWAIGGWFVPFLNLVRPVQIANEILLASERRGERHSGIVFFWWVCWLAAGFGSRIVDILDGDTVGDGVTYDTARLVVMAIVVLAAVFAIVMIGRISSRQDERLDLMLADATVVGVPG